nr:hypothetical protein [Actinomycetota bacterium]
MKLRDGVRESVGQFGPLAAIAVGLALLIALVPSTNSDRVRAGGSFDLGPGSSATADGQAGSGATVDGGSSAGVAADGSVPGVRASGGRGRNNASPGSGGAGSLYSGENCSRQKVIAELSCRPIWRGGQNGGDLDRGVQKDKIRLVIYATPGNPQVNAILAAAGGSSAEDTQAAIDAHTKFWNKYFETYGRKVEVIWKVGPGDGADPAQMQADATAVAEEMKAFAVVSISSAQAFHKELARRGVPSFTGILPLTRKLLEDMAPFTYSALPESDLLWEHFSEYWCTRLRGGMAEHAGDPRFTSQPRKLGIIHIEQDYANLGGDLNGWLQKTCGMQAAKTVSYTPDITRAAQIAANVIAQMKEAGVTTVTCVCDPIAPIFLTDEASRQQWFPEWIHNGFYGGDTASAGRLYDQVQWSH